MARDPSFGAAQIMIGIRMLLARWGGAEKPHDVIGRIMRQNRLRRRLGAMVLALLAAESPDAAAWDALVCPLLQLLEESVGIPIPPKAKSFAEWVRIEVAPGPRGRESPALPINVDVQTIHSVKGENHQATLVLETQYRKHDVSMIFKSMTDPNVMTAALTPGATMHHRRMFVAMSRPRRLLCMAAAAAHLNAATRAALESQGWNVIDLSQEDRPTP